MPAWFIIFSIGILISSWIVSGTIPMLVYYGIKIIHPSYIYFFAFIVPIIFSTMTGTSWGSVGTVGIVIVGIATVLGANLGITVGAIVGGAFFGDKMSPLSDTTNIAAIDLLNQDLLPSCPHWWLLLLPMPKHLTNMPPRLSWAMRLKQNLINSKFTGKFYPDRLKIRALCLKVLCPGRPLPYLLL